LSQKFCAYFWGCCASRITLSLIVIWPVVGVCKQGNDTSCFIKFGIFMRCRHAPGHDKKDTL
jgi:hypothetical protein